MAARTATVEPTAAIGQLMAFQTQTLNQKLVRASASGSRSIGNARAGGAAGDRDGSRGPAAGGAPHPGVRVNNFFLS